MTKIRKEKNRYWSKDEKLRIVKRVIEDSLSSEFVAKDENISAGMLRGWVKKYLEGVENALENKRKPGNQLAKYCNKKGLTKIEKLEY